MDERKYAARETMDVNIVYRSDNSSIQIPA